MNIVQKKTVVVDSDCRFDKLVKVSCITSVDGIIYTLVIDLIGQLGRDVIGHLSVKP